MQSSLVCFSWLLALSLCPVLLCLLVFLLCSLTVFLYTLSSHLLPTSFSITRRANLAALNTAISGKNASLVYFLPDRERDRSAFLDLFEYLRNYQRVRCFPPVFLQL